MDCLSVASGTGCHSTPRGRSLSSGLEVGLANGLRATLRLLVLGLISHRWQLQALNCCLLVTRYCSFLLFVARRLPPARVARAACCCLRSLTASRGAFYEQRVGYLGQRLQRTACSVLKCNQTEVSFVYSPFVCGIYKAKGRQRQRLTNFCRFVPHWPTASPANRAIGECAFVASLIRLNLKLITHSNIYCCSSIKLNDWPSK